MRLRKSVARRAVAPHPRLFSGVSIRAFDVPATTNSTVKEQAPTISRLLRQRAVWVHALVTIGLVLQKAVVAVSVTWCIAFVYSRGDIFRGVPVAQQSYDTFILALLLWTQFMYCAIGSVTQAALLRNLHFHARPEVPASIAWCYWRIVRRSFGFYLIAVALLLAATWVFSRQSVPLAIRQYKPELYCCWAANYVYTVGLGLVGQHVFKTETIEGQRRMASASSAQDTRLVSSVSVAPTGNTVAPMAPRFGRGWWRMTVVRAPMLLSVTLAAVYVQVLQSFVTVDSAKSVLALVLCNFFGKLIIQAAAKRSMLRPSVKHVRTMFLAVVLPTVLMDTQLRVVVQRVNSTQLTVTGTVVMSLLEMTIRLTKAVMLRRQIRRLERHRPGQLTQSEARQPSLALARRKIKLLAFRSAELYADMSAEYIAMGCSMTIFYFYWDHPKYRLGGTAADGVSAWSSQQTLVLVLQVAAEIAVDLVACLVEIAHGLTFHALRQQSVYLATLSASMAVCNITVSALVYLRTEL
ncbi:hypothetical protein P43SY_001702 [Pythium insidiosum]|uniref:Transmembrane protein n=1 Tax=Pythium insidiosum TaxID=114742 RepID=A0AAD5M100_PYTIN|nr:hypothetical protein P43SY_001702 [Pythium insidiosum]